MLVRLYRYQLIAGHDDSDVEIRYLALGALERGGVIVSDVDAKNIIVKSERPTGALSIARPQPTPAEERYWDLYRHLKLCSYDEADLLKSIKTDGVFNWEAEFALYASSFGKHGLELRASLVDGFRAAMDQKFEAYKVTTSYLGDAHINQVSGLITYIRTKLVTDGLRILADHANKADLQLVRKCLDEFEPYCSESVLKFLEKFGGWEDVDRVAKFAGRTDTRYFGLLGAQNNHQQFAAKIIASLCKARVVDFFELGLSSYMLQQVLPYISHKAFGDLSNEKIISLFNNEADSFRKALTLKVIAALPRRRVKEIHRSYSEANEYRYYNVIHWLDLGVTLPSATVKLVIARAPRVF